MFASENLLLLSLWVVDAANIRVQSIYFLRAALNMLAAAVADLPNPKVFRRPSTRQPESQVVCNSPGQMVPKALLNKNRWAAQPKPLSGDNTTIQSTLRVSSSVPDLSVAFRQSSENPHRRRDIRDLNWDEAVDQKQHSAGLSGHQSDNDTDRSKNLSVRKSKRRNKLPVGVDSVTTASGAGVDMDEQFGDVLQQLHSKQTRMPKKRQDTKRVPLKPVKRTPLSRITDEDTFAELTMLSPDTLPEKVGRSFLVFFSCFFYATVFSRPF
ncbi:hypothetical protein AHF37_11461 [Paragonimus kellicotti]|nr:hypothetical protein AHF37_11461 [Paragonimus kellicotti]